MIKKIPNLYLNIGGCCSCCLPTPPRFVGGVCAIHQSDKLNNVLLLPGFRCYG